MPLPQCNNPGDPRPRVGCVGVPETVVAPPPLGPRAHFAAPDCSDASAVGCVRVPQGSLARYRELTSEPRFVSAASFEKFRGQSITTAVAMGDIDGDGHLDMVLSSMDPPGNRSDDTSGLLILLGDGNGNFTNFTRRPTVTDDIRALAMGDVDGDGDLDLLIATTEAVNILLLNNLNNDSDGSFTKVKLTAMVDNSTALAMGDVDGDGDLDVLIGNDGHADKLLVNSGNGAFRECDAFSGRTGSTRAVAMGDVDGDDDIDILIGIADAPDELLLGDGRGLFAPADSLPNTAASSTLSLAMGDIDGDGDLDALIGNPDGTDNALWLNDGSGNFTAELLPQGSAEAHSVAMGDVDGDGDLDLIIGTTHGAASELRLNEGSYRFRTALGFPGGNFRTLAVALGDVNGDGAIDVLIGNAHENDGGTAQTSLVNYGAPNALILSDRSGAFIKAAGFPGGSAGTMAIVMGDVDGDGALDVLLGNPGSDPNELLLNDGSGNFTAADGFPTVPNEETWAVAMGDVDSDGDLDLFIGGSSSTPNRLLINDGSGRFSQADGLPDTHGTRVRAVAFGDVDSDGDLDLFIGNNCDDAHQLLLNEDGTGNFSVAARLPNRTYIGSCTYMRTTAVAMGDVDGDGSLDVFIGNENGVNQLLTNNGSGFFTYKSDFESPTRMHNTFSVAMADVDGDGDLDLLVANEKPPGAEEDYYKGGTQLMLNDGTGNFDPPVDLPDAGSRAYAIAVGDVDADGDVDILVGHGDNQPNELLINNGTGGFGVATDFPSGSVSSYAVALGDVDGDGDLDALIGNAGPNELFAYVHCATGGAQLHASSACFACVQFMGRTPSGVCHECRPDEVSQGTFEAETCSISCVLGERPVGADQCTRCKDIAGTFYNASIVRDESDPTTWAAPRCEACPAGSSAHETGATCITCSPGQFAPGPSSATCQPCAAGTFSEQSGRSICDACQLGGYCESEGQNSALMAWTGCPAGTMGNVSGLKNASECAPCTRGHYCPEGRRNQHARQNTCPAGRFGAEERLPDSQCSGPCPPGHYCEAGSISNDSTPCPAGTFLTTEGGTREGDCQACPRGFFCPAASAEPVPCPGGRYGDRTGLPNASCSGECAQGYYCEVASVSAKAAPCAEGSFSNATALPSQANCSSCFVGQSCPAAARKPLPCRPGTAQPNVSQGACIDCTTGTFVNHSGATACFDCPEGSYCASGTSNPLPCAAGSFGNDTGLGSQDECHECPTGHFCFAGAREASACGAGTYATNRGSPLCSACQEGKYQDQEGATDCVDCDEGSSCPEGSVVQIRATCAEGTYANATLNRTCVGCPEGKWCAGGATQPQLCRRGGFCLANASSPEDCPAGRYGREEGLKDALCTGTCLRGHFCQAGSAQPSPCPAGRFGPTAGLTNESACLECRPGFFCTTGAVKETSCAPGSIASNASSAACEPCEAGRYQPAGEATFCEICTEFSWCAEGSSAPTPCPRRTYGNRTGLQSADQCRLCEKGFWCSAGEALRCGASTYNNRSGSDNVDDCTACPLNSFSVAASTSVEACRCNEGYYDADSVADSVDCQPCPVGSTCEGEGATLTTLPLLEGYYRASSTSADPRACPTYAGVLGQDRCSPTESNGTCRDDLSGVYCTACPPKTYLSSGGECVPCEGLTASTVASCAAVALVILAFMMLVLCSRHLSLLKGRVSAWRRVLASVSCCFCDLSRVAVIADASGLAAKAKQLVSFYQMATSIQSAFSVTYPAQVRAVLSVFELVSLNLFELGLPLECMGLGSFLQRLMLMLIAPLCLVLCTLPIAARPCFGDGGGCSGRAILLRALPMVLKLLFIVFPLVSAVAVQAFDCDELDNGVHWLRADYSLRCGSNDVDGTMQPSAEYENVRLVAALALLLYPFGVPLLFLSLLLWCRTQLSRLAPSTPLSSSLSFLSGEYRKRFFVWEVFECVKKLFFISFIRLIQPGTLSQLLLANVAALSCLVCQVTAAPFKRATDNFLAVVTGAAYCSMLLGALTLRLEAIYEALRDQDKLSPQLRHIFSVPSLPVLVVLLASALAALGFSVLVLLREVLRDLRQPKLRYAGTRAPVEVPLPTGKKHHIFLSHCWGTGQDQARVLRGRLQSVAPGLRVWLDVEDLADISRLEEAVDESGAVLVLLTAGYFQSRNCMRELVHCVSMAMPLIAVAERDSAHGGLTEAEARQQCVAAGAKFASWGFVATGPQAKAVADAVLGSSKAVVGVGTIPRQGDTAPFDGGSGGGDMGPIVYERVGVFQQTMLRLIVQRLLVGREIFLPGEMRVVRRPGSLAPPLGRHHVWCSSHNPGALEVLDELKHAGGYEGKLLVTEAQAQLPAADHVLLYLARGTWLHDVDDNGARKRALAGDIRVALQAGRKLLLLHETDEDRGGVAQFAHFFEPDQTPAELLELNIYADIAIAMKAGPYRTVSLGLFDRAIRVRQVGSRSRKPITVLQGQQAPTGSQRWRVQGISGMSLRRLLGGGSSQQLSPGRGRWRFSAKHRNSSGSGGAQDLREGSACSTEDSSGMHMPTLSEASLSKSIRRMLNRPKLVTFGTSPEV